MRGRGEGIEARVDRMGSAGKESRRRRERNASAPRATREECERAHLLLPRLERSRFLHRDDVRVAARAPRGVMRRAREPSNSDEIEAWTRPRSPTFAIDGSTGSEARPRRGSGKTRMSREIFAPLLGTRSHAPSPTLVASPRRASRALTASTTSSPRTSPRASALRIAAAGSGRDASSAKGPPSSPSSAAAVFEPSSGPAAAAPRSNAPTPERSPPSSSPPSAAFSC